MRDEGPTIGPLDDQLAARLLHQRIVVLGQEVDDAIANRICAQLLLLSAEDPRARHQPLHQLPGRLGLAPGWRSTTRCG